ncbi:MAG TPA: PQQ-binding-like beta-propeller repeat protein [Stellaceae bacterium]|jgi:outer membrane protein assembly factor BamB|nr:PQQ-binding-like beta-propeller repeat protein [Stellaceae bacterium]
MSRLFTVAIAVLALGLASCDIADTIDSLLPEAPKPPLPGKRVSVLNLEQQVRPDPSIQEVDVRLPQPVVNRDWPEAGGYPSHAMYHLALGEQVHEAWSRSFGQGNSRAGQVLAAPVIENGRIFTMDAESVVTAFDAGNGRRLWKFDTQPKKANTTTFGGGVAALGNRVYVATGYAELLALDAATGKELWRRAVPDPLHAAPTVADGRVFAVTVQNQLEVLAADDGRILWTHNGLPETAGLLGGSSPAVEGDIVVVAYSSGEVFALRVENGRPLWTDNLASARGLDALTQLADIRGRPVIDHGLVFAISHSGRMVAIDLRTGDRVWEQDIGGTYTPWVAGDYVYVLTNEYSVVCLTRREGKIKWVLDLPRYENQEKKKSPLDWSGPLLASDRLIVLASNGDAISISPYTGKPLGRIVFSDGSYVAPVLANQTLYIVTQGADLIAYR